VQAAPREEKQWRRVFAKVVDVYDGDTFTICYCRDNTLVRRRCRCYGYDSPELRTSNPAEKEAAVRARNFLANCLPTSRPIRLQIYGTDKYGRYLVSYIHNGISLAQYMIDNGHGVAYNGGSKPKWQPAKI
jgi:endonuclease YncB( thermonuclease family)